MSQALDIISREHRGMWRLTTALAELAGQLGDSADKPDTELFRLILDYIEQYIDRVHQPKEESYLYRAIRERVPESVELLAEFEREHASSPQRVARLRRLLHRVGREYPDGVSEFRLALDDYVAMMRRHIIKEESELFPIARRHLGDVDWDEINSAFADNADPLFGGEAQAEFRALMSRIVNCAPEPIGLGLDCKAAGADAAVTGAPPVLLAIEGLASHYGRIQALRQVDIEIRQGQLVALVGANGAGKTTLLRAISGVQAVSAGRVAFAGEDITTLPAARRVRLGICQVPEGRQVFGPLSVDDNIRLGAWSRRDRVRIAEDLEAMYAVFPILRQKAKLAAGTLSGGQQQMLAMARALMGRPQLLLLDEPSMGLAPLLVEEIFSAIIRLREQGRTIFLVEQNAPAALAIADRAYVIETGETILSGTGQELLANEKVQAAYLGI